jgi:hypothetical protein
LRVQVPDQICDGASKRVPSIGIWTVENGPKVGRQAVGFMASQPVQMSGLIPSPRLDQKVGPITINPSQVMPISGSQ